MKIPVELQSVLTSNPETLGGSVRFAGTRVPVQALLDALADGDSVDYFLEGYPGVTREQVAVVIRWEQDEARKTFGIELAA